MEKRGNPDAEKILERTFAAIRQSKLMLEKTAELLKDRRKLTKRRRNIHKPRELVHR